MFAGTTSAVSTCLPRAVYKSLTGLVFWVLYPGDVAIDCASNDAWLRGEFAVET